MTIQLIAWLESLGLTELAAEIIAQIAIAAVLLLALYLLSLLFRKALPSAIASLIRGSNSQYDDFFLNRGVFRRIIQFIPLFILYLSAPLLPMLTEGLQRFLGAVLLLLGVLIIDSILNALLDIYNSFEIAKQRPIKGYVQFAKIILYLFGVILIIAVLSQQSPWALIGGLSALSAVLLLIFRDTLLGLVAGVQLTTNDMVRIGDWIEMPKYDADGDVLDMTVNSIIVQNWDKTITTIPAYALISDSFTNWRGMSESGGRRIKRALYLDMHSVRFCDEALLQRLDEIQLLTGYIENKRLEISKYNQDLGVEPDDLLNGRHLTNVGTFRAYVLAYLRNHPKIHQDMTLLVRQLAPTDHGLPLELYTFSNDQNWANYESIQADIFDHLLAILPDFQLRIFQNPSGQELIEVKMVQGV
jgi:miniconductance mechanosensitive channel